MIAVPAWQPFLSVAEAGANQVLEKRQKVAWTEAPVTISAAGARGTSGCPIGSDTAP